MEGFLEVVEYYQHLFGLDNWKITGEVRDDFDHNAMTKADPRYFTAHITISRETNKNQDTWDTIIVHELIHVVMSLYDFYVDNAAKEGTQDLLQTARESATSQLGHIFLRLMRK